MALLDIEFIQKFVWLMHFFILYRIIAEAAKVADMGILSWVILGLIVGVIAKFIIPGKDPGGILVTIGLGVAGAFIGGYIGSTLGIGDVTGFDIQSLVIAVGGSIFLLMIHRLFLKR